MGKYDAIKNTLLMGGHVAVSHGVAQGPRLKIDLTTGLYRFEVGNVPEPLQPLPTHVRPQ